MNKWLALFVLMVGAAAFPNTAAAQYKNASFGLDVGYMMNTRPSLYNDNGNLLSYNKRPNRLSDGFRLGIETNLKMDEDHWWFNARFSTAFLRYGGAGFGKGDPNEVAFDSAAEESLGTIFGIHGQVGVRYVILTDYVRPYIQVGISYMRLFSFSSSSDSFCQVDPSLCTSPYAQNTVALPHPNLLGIHIEPGIEFIFTRDVAFRMFVDGYRWLIINAADNHGLAFGLGITFFI